MIKMNLARDYPAFAEKKQPAVTYAKIHPVWYAYIAATALTVPAFGYLWNSSGGAIKNAAAENQRLEARLKETETLRGKSAELEQKKKERLIEISVIESLRESQKRPVQLLNVVIQSIPQNRDIRLTSLEQTGSGVKIQGSAGTPEAIPEFMAALTQSGIFTGVDIEVLERHDEISNFSILCAGNNQSRQAE